LRVTVANKRSREASYSALLCFAVAPVLAGGVPSIAIAQSIGHSGCLATLDGIGVVAERSRVYGVAIRTKPNVAAVRVFINTKERQYAVVLDDLPKYTPPGSIRYLSLADASPVESAWIDRAGATVSRMSGCSRPIIDVDEDAAVVNKREAIAGDALRARFVPEVAVVAATDVTDVAPSERCFEPTITPHVVAAAAPVMPIRTAGTVTVRVDLDAQSRQTSVTVFESSGSPLLDDSAVTATLRSRFLTGSTGCRPRAASFRYIVHYTVGAR